MRKGQCPGFGKEIHIYFIGKLHAGLGDEIFFMKLIRQKNHIYLTMLQGGWADSVKGGLLRDIFCCSGVGILMEVWQNYGFP